MIWADRILEQMKQVDKKRAVIKAAMTAQQWSEPIYVELKRCEIGIR